MSNRPLVFLSLVVSCSLATYTYQKNDAPSLLDYSILKEVSQRSLPKEDSAAQSKVDESKDLESLADSIYQGKIKKSSESFPVLNSLFVEWGATEPQAAMAYLRKAPQGIQRFSGAVLRGWAQNGDIAGASRWIESNIGPTLSTPFYEAVVDGLQDVDKHATALDLIQELPLKAQSGLAQHALEIWTKKDQKAASLWLEKNDEDLSTETLEGSLNGYAKAWADQSPTIAADWANSLPSDELRSKVLSSAIDTWVQNDPDSAGEWLLNQEPDDSIEHVLSETAHKISHLDPALAFELIENDRENLDQPYRLRGHLIMALDNLIHKNPAAAGPWIAKVEQQTKLAAESDPTNIAYRVPKESYVAMISHWASEDETAAFDYLASAPQLSDSERAEIEVESQRRLQALDPEKAAYQLFKQWNDIDQAAATQFARSLPQDYWQTSVSDIKLHYQEVAAAWAKSDPEHISHYLLKQKLLSSEETDNLLLAINSPDF